MKQIGIVFLLVLFSGCSFKHGNVSIVSTKDVDFKKTYIKGEKKVVGKDVSKIYIVFPDKVNPMTDSALSNALDENCAIYLTDVNITRSWWFIPYIYGEVTLEVEGYPWYESGKESCQNKI